MKPGITIVAMGILTAILLVAPADAAAISTTSEAVKQHPCPIDKYNTTSDVGVAVCVDSLAGVPVLCVFVYEDDDGDQKYDHGEETALNCIAG